jgi:hypothetical protein
MTSDTGGVMGETCAASDFFAQAKKLSLGVVSEAVGMLSGTARGGWVAGGAGDCAGKAPVAACGP